jgi:hypothetical protein
VSTVNSSGATATGQVWPSGTVASSGLSSIPWWGWGIAAVGLWFVFSGGKH